MKRWCYLKEIRLVCVPLMYPCRRVLQQEKDQGSWELGYHQWVQTFVIYIYIYQSKEIRAHAYSINFLECLLC